MTCQQVQSNLSLYLYGELDFAREEAVESHLEECAFCQLALAREKAWHSSLNAQQTDVPLDMLAACRRDLDLELRQQPRRPLVDWFERFSSLSQFSPARVTRAAMAGLLIIAGFGAGRWTEKRLPPTTGFAQPFSESSLGDPYTRIRSVQATTPGVIRIVLDRVTESQLTGPLTDSRIRGALVSASRDAQDPGIRVDSVTALSSQPGTEVRDALLDSVQQDPNAAVRLKAVEGLRSFVGDSETRATLVNVLRTDEDPSVRSAAIDVLLPANEAATISPDLLRAFEDIAQSQPQDDYIRARCLQVIHNATVGSDQVY